MTDVFKNLLGGKTGLDHSSVLSLIQVVDWQCIVAVLKEPIISRRIALT